MSDVGGFSKPAGVNVHIRPVMITRDMSHHSQVISRISIRPRADGTKELKIDLLCRCRRTPPPQCLGEKVIHSSDELIFFFYSQLYKKGLKTRKEGVQGKRPAALLNTHECLTRTRRLWHCGKRTRDVSPARRRRSHLAHRAASYGGRMEKKRLKQTGNKTRGSDSADTHTLSWSAEGKLREAGRDK